MEIDTVLPVLGTFTDATLISLSDFLLMNILNLPICHEFFGIFLSCFCKILLGLIYGNLMVNRCDKMLFFVNSWHIACYCSQSWKI